MESYHSEGKAKGVNGSLLIESEATIIEWLEAGEFEKVLCQFQEWDDNRAGWWTRYGKYLEQIPTTLINNYPRILLRTILPLAWAGNEVEAFELQKALEDRFQDAGDTVSIMDARISRANLYLVTHKWQKAMESFEAIPQDSLEVYQRLRVLNSLGILYATKSFRLDLAREQFVKVEELSLDSGDSISYIVAMTNRAWHVELLQGRFREALLIADTLWSVRQVSGESRFPRVCSLLIRGAVEYELGRDKAPETLRDAYQLNLELDYRDNAFAAAELMACWYAERNDHEQMLHWVKTCEAIQGVDLHKVTAIHWSQARDDANRGDISAMTRHLTIAQEAAEVLDVKIGTLIESARCHFEIGRIDEAVEEASKAIELADQHDMRYQAARARLIYCACEVRGVRSELRKLMQSSILNEYDELFTQRERSLALRVMGHALTLEIELDYARSLASKMGEDLVRVRAFGGLQVGIGNCQLGEDVWVRPKARALFAYLCLHHRQPVPVEQVIEAFWPDHPFESARNSLRVMMSYIRGALNQDKTKKRRQQCVPARKRLGQARSGIWLLV